MSSLVILALIAVASVFQNASSIPTAARTKMDLSQDPVDVAKNGFQLIGDQQFSGGFLVTPACATTRSGTACPKASDYYLFNPSQPAWNTTVPLWRMRQHSSAGNLPEVGQMRSDGGVTWRNEYKDVTLFPDGRIRLTTNGLAEYDGAYPSITQSKGWPHLLMSQSFARGVYARSFTTLDKLTSVKLSFDFQLLYARLNQGQGYDPSRSGAIFPMYILVQNLNKAKGKEGGYGQLAWLGLGPYNDRLKYPVIDEDHYKVDLDRTNFLIYTMPFQNFASHRTTHDGEKVHFEGDILPYAKRAVDVGYKEGLLKSKEISDYKIAGINMGFEVIRALNVTTVELQNLSLRAIGNSTPKVFEFNEDGTIEGWRYTNMAPIRSVAPFNGRLTFRTEQDNASLISPPLSLDASTIKKVVVRVARDGGRATSLRMYFAINGRRFVPSQSLSVDVPGNGGWKEYIFDMTNVSSWSGTITGIRFDPIAKGESRTVFGFDYIRFLPADF